MKLLRKYASMLAVAVLAFGTTACSDDNGYEPAQLLDGAQVAFSNESTTSFTLDAATSSVSVDLVRANADNEIQVPVALTSDEAGVADLFTVTPYAAFAAGETKASVQVAFDRSALADGAVYTVKLSIADPALTTIYGAAETTLTLSVPEPYVLLGKGLFREDCFTTFWSVDNLEYEVEIYENTNNPGFIYLKNPYGKPYPYNEPGDYVEEDVYFAIQISEATGQALIPKQNIGCDWGYGEIFIGTAALGTYQGGVITFPEKGLLIGMPDYNNGGLYYANLNGMFRVVMPGVVLTDYSLEVAYGGFRAEADNTSYPVLDLTCGADVASVNYVFVDGFQRDCSATVAGIVDGSIESIPAAVTGGGTTELLCETALDAGVYTVVVVPADAEGNMQAADAASVSFYFVGAGVQTTPAVQVQTRLFPFSALFDPAKYPAYDDTNAMVWIVAGQEIKNLAVGFFKTSSVASLLDKGATIEQIAEANCSELGEDYLTEMDETGQTYDVKTGLTAGESYTFIVLAENIYGNTSVVTSSLSTEAAPEATAVVRSELKPSAERCELTARLDI